MILLRAAKIMCIVLSFLFLACAHKPTVSQTQEDVKKETQEVYSATYPLFLQARLGSLNINIMEEACFGGVKAACHDAAFLFSRNNMELQGLCFQGIAPACYKLGEQFLDAPLGDTLSLSSLYAADSVELRTYMKKSCELGFLKACAVQGALLLQDDFNQAFTYLIRSCEGNAILGCYVLYTALQDSSSKTQEHEKALQYAYAKILDFGMDNLLCKDSSCVITGELAYADTMNQECKKGSGLACVALAHLFKRDNKEIYLMQGSTQTKWIKILEPHCFSRQYVPACQALMELYFIQKKGYEFVYAGEIACKSDFYARGMVRYEREAQICTRVGDIFLDGVYIVGKEVLQVPKDKDRALYLYKIGCERGNEGRACNKLERILKEDAHLVAPLKNSKP